MIIPDPRTAFVAMKFSEERWRVYRQAIRPAIETCGLQGGALEPETVYEDILGEMKKRILSVELLIADTTEQNPNVFYEIGVAETLGKPVIYLTSKVSEIPFDINVKFHEEYYPDDPERLLDRLSNRIRLVLGLPEGGSPRRFVSRIVTGKPAHLFITGPDESISFSVRHIASRFRAPGCAWHTALPGETDGLCLGELVAIRHSEGWGHEIEERCYQAGKLGIDRVGVVLLDCPDDGSSRGEAQHKIETLAQNYDIEMIGPSFIDERTLHYCACLQMHCPECGSFAEMLEKISDVN